MQTSGRPRWRIPQAPDKRAPNRIQKAIQWPAAAKSSRKARAGRLPKAQRPQGAVKRATKETDIEVAVDLDGKGVSNVSTGIGFFDHMLDLLARHSRIDITVKAKGDLHIDHHHTTEDVGIALGQAVKQALGDMKGITRYADVHVPMDEALTRVAIDVSGRPFLVFKAKFGRDKVGAFDTELVQEWFQAFAMNAGITLHVEMLYGTNDHHIAEACFKGLARALRAAFAIDPRAAGEVPSTKGTLGRLKFGGSVGERHDSLHGSRAAAAQERERHADPERFVFVRDGFYFWAFLLGPVWMLWRRLWLVLRVYHRRHGGGPGRALGARRLRHGEVRRRRC